MEIHVYILLHLLFSLQIVQYLIEKGADIEAQNQYQYTPLHIACLKGHLEIVQYLIEKRANIEAKNKNQKTPLHFACKEGHLYCSISH